MLLSTATLHANPIKTEYTTVALMIEQETLPVDGGTVTVGLHLEPIPKWHTYWKNPGDAGLKPSVNWDLPEGFSISEFSFPTPHLLPFGELITYGYEKDVLLLAELEVPASSGSDSYRIGGKASWVVCDDLQCIPEEADVWLDVGGGSGDLNPAQTDRFAQARDQLPVEAPFNGSFDVLGKLVAFEIETPGDFAIGTDPYLYIAEKRLVKYSTQSFSQNGNVLRFEMLPGTRADEREFTEAVLADGASDKSYRLDFSRGSVVGSVLGTAGPMAAEAAGAVTAATGFSLSAPSSLFAALIAAFIGGVILNLMPCVFPILSIKALSLVESGQGNIREARFGGIMYTVGILASFVVIGIAVILFREAGAAVGWGFHLQSPLVNITLALLMVAVGLNLLGVFEFGTSLMGLGGSVEGQGKGSKAFLTGLLAVVVATPCTVPFMAPAIGWALTQSSIVSLATLLALGFGLAFPYLLVSFLPALQRFMPRPGAWMEIFRKVLAFPMLLTAVWLLWVVGRQLGVSAMGVTLIAVIALAFALWAYGRGTLSNLKLPWHAVAGFGLVCCLAATFYATGMKAPEPAVASTSAGTLGGLELEHFSPDGIEAHLANKDPLFVYFTADWCVTCKANEIQALATDTVAAYMNENDISVMVGDWTSRDAEITDFLASYDRAGVPLYLYYPPGSAIDGATVLPQILIPGVVINHIENANSQSEQLIADDEVAEEEEPKPIPDAEPEWGPAQAYLDADDIWHEIDDEIRASDDSREEKLRRYEEERGPHPDIEPGIAAALAILKKVPNHEKRLDAVKFLIEEPYGSEFFVEATEYGVEVLINEFPDYEDWPAILRSIDFAFWYGRSEIVDDLFDSFPNFVEDPVAVATARYYNASRHMRHAQDFMLSEQERSDYRLKAIKLAFDLSNGVEDQPLVKRQRFLEDGTAIPFPTLREAEYELLNNLTSLMIGDKLEQASALNLDGEIESLANYEGKAVLLDFWATWCGPCIAGLPKLRELKEDLEDQDFEILSISVDDRVDTITDFLVDEPMPWAHWHIGPDGDLLRKWVIRGYPTYLLIDQEGRITAKAHSVSDELTRKIHGWFAEQERTG